MSFNYTQLLDALADFRTSVANINHVQAKINDAVDAVKKRGSVHLDKVAILAAEIIKVRSETVALLRTIAEPVHFVIYREKSTMLEAICKQMGKCAAEWQRYERLVAGTAAEMDSKESSAGKRERLLEKISKFASSYLSLSLLHDIDMLEVILRNFFENEEYRKLRMLDVEESNRKEKKCAKINAADHNIVYHAPSNPVPPQLGINRADGDLGDRKEGDEARQKHSHVNQMAQQTPLLPPPPAPISAPPRAPAPLIQPGLPSGVIPPAPPLDFPMSRPAAVLRFALARINGDRSRKQGADIERDRKIKEEEEDTSTPEQRREEADNIQKACILSRGEHLKEKEEEDGDDGDDFGPAAALGAIAAAQSLNRGSISVESIQLPSWVLGRQVKKADSKVNNADDGWEE